MKMIRCFSAAALALLLAAFAVSADTLDKNHQPGMDICVEFIGVEFESVTLNSQMILKVIVLSAGTEPLPPGLRLNVKVTRYGWDSKTVLGIDEFSGQISPLKRGERQTFTWQLPRKSGIFSFDAEADPEGKITETRLANNKKNHIISVGIPPVHADKTDFKIDYIFPERGPYPLYRKIPVTCSISNDGKAVTPGLDIELRLTISNEYNKIYKLKTTGGRDSKYAGKEWTPAEPGTYTITCEILKNYLIPDDNPENNRMSVDIKIHGRGKRYIFLYF